MRPPDVPAWTQPSLRGLMVVSLLGYALSHAPPEAYAVMALAPFFVLGLFTRYAAAALFVIALTQRIWLEPWILVGMPVATALLLLGAGRWALDPIEPGVIWARGIGAVMGRHPTNRAWRELLQRQIEDQRRKKDQD